MIKQIINDLIDDEKSLVSPLLKTKVFASRIGNKILLNWVNKELNGYSMEDDLPEYRIGSATSSCTLRQGYAIQENTPVPVSFIQNEKLRDFFTQFEYRDSVKTLESYFSDKGNDTLMKILPIDFWAFLTREFRKNGFQGEIRDIKKTSHISSITQTLTEIRSKFLDLMISLESEFPDLPEDFSDYTETTKENLTQTINYIMGDSYNITNSGDGSTINTGDKNSINSASGSDINQENQIDEAKKEQIETLLKEIRDVAEKIEINKDDKEDLLFETERISSQLTRDNPKKNIISQSLNTVFNILTSVTANVLTNPIVENIQTLLTSL